ncbi:hypothetical protein [Pseudaquabacterium terrae]|nr:hypothetical protein [Aquabacterium terrae]
MHLIVPFAAVPSDAGRQALHDLPLPQLERLLARLQPAPVDAGDELALSPPHERALAQALGWPVIDGKLPWAARLAAAQGLPTGDHAWGLLTPLHLQVGTEQVSMTDPASLQLDEAASRELLDIVRPLLETEGFTLHWAAPLQWLATHPVFDGLATASLDRVVGRNIDPWLPDRRAARLIRRIENEVQMLLYTHPLNDRREAAGLPSVNSFWASGCGRALPEAAPAPIVDDRLRAPALGEDWIAWREAWQQLEAGPVAALARHDGPVTLTLCGERAAQAFETGSPSLWERVSSTWRRPALHTILEAL